MVRTSVGVKGMISVRVGITVRIRIQVTEEIEELMILLPQNP